MIYALVFFAVIGVYACGMVAYRFLFMPISTPPAFTIPEWHMTESQPKRPEPPRVAPLRRPREVCEVCDQPVALRTHDGHWRCVEHKSSA